MVSSSQIIIDEHAPNISTGEIHNPIKGSLTGRLEWLGGIETRTPLEYNEYNWQTGKEFNPERPLTKTGETIHPSVRLRMGLPGKGLSDSGEYNPEALYGWTVVGTAAGPINGPVTLEQIQQGQKSIEWRKKVTDAKTGQDKILYLPEAILSPIEFDLFMSVKPGITANFLSTVPK